MEFILDKIGNEYEGVISGVTEWGIFIEEKDAKIEGLVRLGSLKNDFYEYNEKKFALVGQRTGVTYRLGDKVKVKLMGADLTKRTIDYEFVE